MRIPFALAGLMAAVTTLAATGQAMAQDFKPRIVRFGYGLVDESNQGRAARFFAKEVEKATGGKMKVRAIGNASLGSDTQMQQALIGGAQEMMVGSTATLVGLSPDAPRLWTDLPSDPRHTALLIGEERHGLSDAGRGICHDLVRLPMSGRTDSLNVGVATGVMLYELVRRGDTGGAERD